MFIFRILLIFCLAKISCVITSHTQQESGKGANGGENLVLLNQLRRDFRGKEMKSKVIYTRDIGDRTYTLHKRHYVNWPDAFEACRLFGASLVHFDNKEELANIRILARDPELGDVEEFWSAAVFDKDSKKPGFVNIHRNHDMNFFSFLRGDSRCVSIVTKKDNSTLIDLNYAYCMRRKYFMCQAERNLTSNQDESSSTTPAADLPAQCYEKEINEWTYSMNMTRSVTWMEAFESCKSRGANLVTAAKFDVKSAWALIKDPYLKNTRFWSAGVLDPKGETIWLGKATNLIDNPSLLHSLQEKKLNCLYHMAAADFSLAFLGPEDAASLPLNHTLCSTKMLFMCEEPTYQILRTDSSEEKLPLERS